MSAAATTDLAIPSSRIAGVENVPSRGRFMLPRAVDAVREVVPV